MFTHALSSMPSFFLSCICISCIASVDCAGLLGLAGYTVKERSVAVNKLLEEEPDFKAILR